MKMIENIAGGIARWAQTPMVLRNVSQVLREVAPVTKVGNNVFVFKYADVVETLTADADFGVTPNYASKMNRTSGTFFLGMEDGPRYRKEQTFSRKGFAAGDDQRIATLTRDAACALLEPLRKGGQFDFVPEYAAQIPLAVLRDYFGVPGPSPEILQRWLSSLFWELFLNFTDETAVTERAADAAREMRPYLLGLVAQVRASGKTDTFLGRLIAARDQPNSGLDDMAVVRNIGGIIIGAMSTQAKAMTLALEELLRRPTVLTKARQAAIDDDDELLAGYIFEALRFNPHNPLVVRHAMRKTEVAAGTPHAVTVNTGDQVFAMTISASFDAKGFLHPLQFDPRRKYEDHLHFGYGMHRCFGARVVKQVLTAALKEILKFDQLHAVVRVGSPVSYVGPYPSSFKIRFSP